jgi:hypothetical protein
MTEEQIALAKRAVACKGWRWMPGMRTDSKFARVVAADEDGAPCAAEEGATTDDCHAVWMDNVPVLPDLTDPATLGCVLALVRKAWESPKANLSWVTDDKCMVVFDTGHAQKFLLASTEAEALVAALESAP